MQNTVSLTFTANFVVSCLCMENIKIEWLELFEGVEIYFSYIKPESQAMENPTTEPPKEPQVLFNPDQL